MLPMGETNPSENTLCGPVAHLNHVMIFELNDHMPSLLQMVICAALLPLKCDQPTQGENCSDALESKMGSI